jgi:hypothetical protein
MLEVVNPLVSRNSMAGCFIDASGTFHRNDGATMGLSSHSKLPNSWNQFVAFHLWQDNETELRLAPTAVTFAAYASRTGRFGARLSRAVARTSKKENETK